MRVFVTGASGLIGRRLVAALHERGDDVVALSRSPQDDAPGIRWVQGSHDDVRAWQGEVDGVDAVVNLAGEPIAAGRWSRRRQREILRSRVGITTALFHALQAATRRPQVLVSASAAGYYGTSPDVVFDEEAPAGDGFLSRVCREWEAAAVRSASLDVRVVRLRIGAVLDPDGGALPKLVMPVRLFVGGALGSGTAWVPWVHHRDLTGLLMRAIDDQRVEGPLNATAPTAVRQRQLAATIGRILNRPIWLDAPALPLRLVLGKMADEMLLGGQQVTPQKALTLGYTFQFADLRAALRDCLVGA